MHEQMLNDFVAESPIVRQPIVDAVCTFAKGLPTGSIVLDAGAGNAPYRQLLAHCTYHSHDWSASVHPGAGQVDIVGDLHAMPVPDEQYDAVLLTEVLEHVADPETVLKEMQRLLRPGGRLLLTVPFVGELHEEPHDHFRFTSHGLRMLLEKAGFVEIEVEPTTGWFGTLANVLRHQAAATHVPGSTPRLTQRVTGSVCLVASRVVHRFARRFDNRLDTRHALPVGWSAVGHKPGPSAAR